MLDRYRKPGGFVQLLNLIETCGPAKQEKFLAMIGEEDPLWQAAIHKKMLSIKKIFSWSQETLAEIIGTQQDLTIAIILHGLEPEIRQRIDQTFSHSQRRKVEDLYNTNKPSPSEVSSMFLKVITEVRKMISDGRLRMDKIDPDLVMDEKFEENLRNGSVGATFKPPAGDSLVTAVDGTVLHFETPKTPEHTASASTSAAHEGEDATALKRKIALLQNENTSLKSELSKVKAKLDQIRKMAA